VKRFATPLLCGLMLTGCASVAPPAGEPNPKDPWEGLNRKVFALNEQIDENMLKPTAQVYQRVVPNPVREGVGNAFSNLSDIWSSLNWMLQGEFNKSMEQGARFAFNTTIGVLGVFDVSTRFGLEKRSQDFGQTLGAWGVGMGPYMVLPLLGPSSLRDTAALPVNQLAGASAWFDANNTKIGAAALNIISTRASLLKAGDLVDGIALDKYTFFRDAYLQRRAPKPKSSAQEDDFEE
jgi:phospholipid-binding lipoprotein MlaA